MKETGRAIAYIKDGLEEMNLISETTINKGRVASAQGTSISFHNSVDTVTNGADWSGTNGSATPPTGWTYYSAGNNAGNANFTTTDGKLIIEHQGSAEARMVGCFQSLTVLSGHTYTLTYTANRSATAEINIKIHSSAFSSGDALAAGDLVNVDNPAVGVGEATYTVDFTPASSTVYIAIGIDGNTSDTVTYDNISVKLKGGGQIKDSNSGFGNFTTSMKVLVDDSTNNDTNESSNSSVGYYTPTVVSNSILIISDTITEEAAGANITIRGQSNNYSDIIKDKRFYSIPSDAIKIKDIRVKNHLNTDDQWRSIPRMVGKPLNTDKDEI
jgi:hypothetical protein